VDDEGRHAWRYFNGDSPMLNDAVAVVGVVANSKLVATTDKYGQIKKGATVHSPYTPSVQTQPSSPETQQVPVLSTPKPRPNVPPKPAYLPPPVDLTKPVSESELAWASQLEKKITNASYSPTRSEMMDYQHIFQRLEHQKAK
jgi:hypothetical protein